MTPKQLNRAVRQSTPVPPGRRRPCNQPTMLNVFSAILGQLSGGGPRNWAYRDSMAIVTEDAKLACLGEAIGAVARQLEKREPLLHAACIAFAWLESLDFKSAAIVVMIGQERARQRELLNAGKILFDCSSPIVDGGRKYRVLLEELGEVAKAVDVWEQLETPTNFKQLVAEITQVAAVTVALLETFEKSKPKKGAVRLAPR